MSVLPSSIPIKPRPSPAYPRLILLALLTLLPTAPLLAQQTAPDSEETRRQIQSIATQLAQTQQQLEASQQQILRLQSELLALQQRLAYTNPPPVPTPAVPASSSATTLAELEEQQQILAAQVKQHDQTKLETASKYPVHVTGLILFNTFINRGALDQIDLPSIALRSPDGVSSSSIGSSLRQTVLGLKATGPRLAGAHTSAEINIDFFGGLPYSNFGTSGGNIRMRTAGVNLDWRNDHIQLGFTNPLISPLSPTSYATVGEPALAWAGNLWTWAPQLRYTHSASLPGNHRLILEAGLWDPPAAGYNSSELLRVASPGELSAQPTYEGRIALAGQSEENGFQFGVGGYFGRQSYSAPFKAITTYASTLDFRLPLGPHLELTGEGYRGQAIGGLGGGSYKDYIFGTNPSTGTFTYQPLNAIGGWTQFKARFTQNFEANASIGLDNGFARDFHAVIQSATASTLQLRARNRMFSTNLIYTPKTYLIFSPEYRRVWTWPITGSANTLDIFTLSAGYRF